MPTHPCLRVFEGHRSQVNGALFLPDGRLVSWSFDRTLRIWEPTGRCLATLSGQDEEILGALVLPDGRLVSWSRDRLCWWDTTTATMDALVAVSCVSSVLLWQGDLVTVSPYAGVRVLHPDNGRELARLEEHVHEVLLTPTGDLALMCLDRLSLWSGRRPWRRAWHADPETKVYGVKLLGDRLVTWSGDHAVRVWSAGDGRLLADYRHPTQWGRVTRDSDGFERRQHIFGARFLPGGDVISWSGYRVLPEWDIESGMLVIWGDQGHRPAATVVVDRAIEDVLVTADGRYILFWAHDSWFSGQRLGVLDVERARSGDTDPTWIEGHDSGVWGGLQLGCGGVLTWSKDLILWDPMNFGRVRKFVGHESTLRGVRARADGTLLTWSYDCTLRLWDVRETSSLGVW